MRLTVVGTGYVGLVTSVVFADFGNHVFGLDVNKQRIKQLASGTSPLFEPQLQELLERGLKTRRLQFTTDYTQALKKTEVIFICVGTPPKTDGEADLSFVFSACESIAKSLKNPAIIVLKSTMPPGTHHELQNVLDTHIKGKYQLASVPEFLREGSAIADTLQPSRIVIGAEDKKTKEKLLDLHAPIAGERVVTDIISAQMIKYAANSFLANKISFANGVARVCDYLGADVTKVMEGVGLDPRIGKDFLNPGLGYGGSCFPKDIKAFSHIAKQAGYDFRLLDEIDQINQTQVDYVVSRAKEALGGFRGKKVGIWGLAFKPNTDDLREARSVVLIKRLLEKGATVNAYDPVVTAEAAHAVLPKSVVLKQDAYAAAEAAAALFLVTEWNEFKKVDLTKVKQKMQGKLLVDGRNLYHPDVVTQAGLTYLGVGRR